MAKTGDPLSNLSHYHENNLYNVQKSRGMYDLDLVFDTKLDEQKKCLSNLSFLSLLNNPQTVSSCFYLQFPPLCINIAYHKVLVYYDITYQYA